MKKIIFKIFNKTIGVFLRWSKSALWEVERHRYNQPMGVHALILKKALEDSASYAISNFSDALIFRTRKELWLHCISRNTFLTTPGGGVIAEFGVWKGESINFFAKNCPKAKVFGFDSFEGLDEDWVGTTSPKGTFTTHGELPKVETNVILIKGLFEDTLPQFVNKNKLGQISLLHMDADTYKPTIFVLNALKNNLMRGTTVIFDEYFGYPNFQSHEFKAWKEFVASEGIQYRYVGFTEVQVALEIL